MKKITYLSHAALVIAAGSALLAGWGTNGAKSSPASEENASAATPHPIRQVAGMRRLTQDQYRNTIADIFGPDIEVAGRFEPIVRPVHEMIASGARAASLSPAGFEQFDAMARVIAGQVFSEEHRGQFVPCTPLNDTTVDAQCARDTLAPLGRYIMRRPMNEQEIEFYVSQANEAVTTTGSFYKGLELALSAMLVSPHFLYVVEIAEPDPDNPGEMRLDNYSRASRLSFLLWNSTPNEALLGAAERGELTDQAKLKKIAESMVESRRFEQGIRAFFADMLLFEKFDDIAKDPIIYPYFNQDIAKSLPEQTLRTIVDHLLAKDGDYRDLFTTRKTFMNRPLASLYQVQVKHSEGWEEYEFSHEDDRAGLLGQAGFLALYSHSGRSSPTLRGRAIRELLLCQPVPDPPGNVNFTAVQDTANKDMPTARIRLNAHNTDPVCAGCHLITDPIGLSLERFDGIGAYRETENGAKIDYKGSIDGVDFVGATGLGTRMTQDISTTQCVTGRALEYAMGKSADDKTKLVEQLEKQFAADKYSIRALFMSVAILPETYRVRFEPLDGHATKVSLSAD